MLDETIGRYEERKAVDRVRSARLARTDSAITPVDVRGVLGGRR
jgi:hypothetical protein